MFSILRVSKNIKKNEGYRNYLYKDQLGNLTIGYGHLVKKSEKYYLKKKYSKNFLIRIFDKDLKKAISDFKKNYKTNNLPNNVQEVLIEMIYQLGIKGVLKFKKFNKHLRKRLYFLAAFEMINSSWYQQTPKRVNKLIIILLNGNAKKKRP